jgi:hypothetical protein
VEAVQLKLTFEPATEANSPVGALGMDIALVPEPLKGTVRFTVPTRFKLAERRPVKVGVKVTVTVQELPTAIEVEQVPPVFVNSEELEVMLVMASVAVPEFEMVTDSGELVDPVF